MGRSLHPKILLWFSISVIVVLISSYYFNYLINQDTTQNAVGRNLENISAQEKSFLNLWFRERQLDIRSIATNPELTSGNIPSIRVFLRLFFVNEVEYADLAYCNLDGVNIADVNPDLEDKLNISDRIYFRRAAAGQENFSDVLIGRNSGEPILVFASPVWRSGVVAGVVIATVRLSRLSLILSSFRFGNKAESYLLDDSGRMLTESHYIEELRRKGKVQSSAIWKYRIHTYGYRQGWMGKTGNAVYRNYLGHSVIGAYDFLSEHHWILLTEIDREEAMVGSLEENLQWGLLAGIVTLLLFLFIAFFQIRRLLLPLHKLTQMAEAISKGDFNYHVKLEGEDELARLAGSFNTMVDALQDSYIHLVRLAQTDQLTGVKNKRFLFEYLPQEIQRSQRYDLLLGLIILDIDHFKAINDTYGHLVGDEVLKNLTQLLTENLRENDVLIRFGGEEFIVVFPHVEEGRLFEAAERLRVMVSEADFPIPEHGNHLTISIGVSAYIPVTEELLEPELISTRLIAQADMALYLAKTNGRNRVESYQDPEAAPTNDNHR